MVHRTGLEPVRINHTPLKRARLPIPPPVHCLTIIAKIFSKRKNFYWQLNPFLLAKTKEHNPMGKMKNAAGFSRDEMFIL